jgi:hypothetical protein
MELGAIVLSALSLLVAAFAAITSWRTQRRQLALENARERDRVRDQQKACLVAGRNKDGVWVSNEGAGTARNVEVLVDGEVISSSRLNNAENARIGPEGILRYTVPLPPLVHAEVEIRWEDDSGEPGYYTSTVGR